MADDPIDNPKIRERLDFPSLRVVAHRVSDAVELGGGEGYGLSTAMFDGRPAVIIDAGTMADFIDESDESDADLLRRLLHVLLFDSEADRAAYLAGLRFYRFTED